MNIDVTLEEWRVLSHLRLACAIPYGKLTINIEEFKPRLIDFNGKTDLLRSDKNLSDYLQPRVTEKRSNEI